MPTARPRALTCAALALAAATGCATNAYVVHIQARDLDRVDPALLDRLDRAAEARGFKALWRVRNDPGPDEFFSTYAKGPATHVVIIWSGPSHDEKQLSVDIDRRDKSAATKEELNSLGDFFLSELARSIPAKSLSVERSEAHVFVF
ncbi:MAG TPA: hypothetical protein VLW85_22765 [Myxococcales bacterium]|nr:hypothetical protein [Myxococcales bacterium]